MKNNGAITFGRCVIDADHWQPIVAAKACNSYVIQNPAPLLLCTDTGYNDDQPDAVIHYIANANPSLILPPAVLKSWRFALNSTLVFARCEPGAQPQELTLIFVA